VPFVFESHPTCFADLEHLIVYDRNLACAEQFKEQSSIAKRDSSVRNNSAFKRTESSRSPVSHTAVVCFYCHRPGHIRRNCHQLKQSSQRQGNSETDQRL
jgi:hypothetical protein